MKMKNGLGTALLLALTGCATGSQIPYRVPQATIRGATSEQVKLPIIQSCVTGGGSVETATSNQVICAKPMDGSFGSMMYRALVTPAYSTNPVVRARYTLVESGGSVFVTIDMFSQYQNAYGQTTTDPVQNGNVAAQAQAMLDRIKASFEGDKPTAPEPTGTAGFIQEPPAQTETRQPTTQPSPAQPTKPDWRNWNPNKSGD